MTGAAADLGIELFLFEFAVDDRFAKIDKGVEIIRTVPDIDGAILSVAFGQAEPLLQDVDNGVGLPPDFNTEARSSMGINSIYALGEEQLDGTVSFTNDAGSACEVIFPKTVCCLGT